MIRSAVQFVDDNNKNKHQTKKKQITFIVNFLNDRTKGSTRLRKK